MTEVVVREATSSAEEFLDVFNRRNPRWPGPLKTWIFRGQAEDWPLLPSALRPSAVFPTEHHGSGFPSDREPWQLFMPRVTTELDVVAVFLAYCPQIHRGFELRYSKAVRNCGTPRRHA